MSLQTYVSSSEKHLTLVFRGIAAVGGGWSFVTPYHRPFSVTDLSISFPYVEDDAFSTSLLFVIALIAPGVIIVAVCFIFVPGRAATAQTPKSVIWRSKLWEWNTGWMGLGLSMALAFLFTQGMKNAFGKPRPDLLARCLPDLSRDSLRANAVGSFATGFSPEWVLVSSDICQQTDKMILDDGFRSFPSGHASTSWAGLLYLSLFLCAKFAITIPYLTPRKYSTDPARTALETHQSSILPLRNGESAEVAYDDKAIPIRNQAAAPPTWTVVLAVFPVAVAIYICTTRYAQFKHFGFDLLGGSTIGVVSAWVGFRWYHLPIRQGAGWAWGARSRDRAFGVPVGVLGYVGREGWAPAKKGVMAEQRSEAAAKGTGSTSAEADGVAEV